MNQYGLALDASATFPPETSVKAKTKISVFEPTL